MQHRTHFKTLGGRIEVEKGLPSFLRVLVGRVCIIIGVGGKLLGEIGAHARGGSGRGAGGRANGRHSQGQEKLERGGHERDW